MPFLGKLFRKKRKRKHSTSVAEEAINNLRDIEALLLKKQEHYEEKIATEVANAKKHGSKNKKLALAALKRKKHHERELSRIDGVLVKVEAQRTALEDAGMNMEVLGVLSQTTNALRIANQKFDLDKVEELMDDIGEGLQLSDEFSTAISRPIGDVVDEDELLGELEDLEKNGAAAVELPNAPAGPITRARASREKVRRMDTEMEELEKWAAAN
ncbi:hypothetical protein Angca_007684 [Angiostrongylus cantonensis]|uniref:SNF7 family protein n=1 Tax=Angiostrongylus cantonensis TaxID=6313 RepID=A0A158PA53_ANGCA|nr:hypothetical protein Angca_007684 [Angiostrongylus cantonensis]